MEEESVEETFEDWPDPHAPQLVVRLELELVARRNHLLEGNAWLLTLNPLKLRLMAQEGHREATPPQSVRQSRSAADAALAHGLKEHREPVARATPSPKPTQGEPQERGCRPGKPEVGCPEPAPPSMPSALHHQVTTTPSRPQVPRRIRDTHRDLTWASRSAPPSLQPRPSPLNPYHGFGRRSAGRR